MPNLLWYSPETVPNDMALWTTTPYYGYIGSLKLCAWLIRRNIALGS